MGPSAEAEPPQNRAEIRFPRFGAPEVMIAIVDDRPGAADLRAALAQSYAELEAEYREHACWLAEPLATRPIDRSLVVVHPSLPPATRYSTPLSDPGLRWQAETRTDGTNETWSAHVKQALEPPSDAQLERFAPLEVFKSLTELLTHRREPVNAAEHALAAAASATNILPVSLLLAGEDDSPQQPATYTGAGEFGSWLLDSVVVPAAQAMPSENCFSGWQSTTERLETWLQEDGRQLWPCQRPKVANLMWDDCSPRCLAWNPRQNAEGSVKCRMNVETDPSTECNAARGRLNPLDADGVRRPRTTVRDGVEVRLCEMPQLEGGALESCRTSRACENCTPGWCWQDFQEFEGVCVDGKFPLRARFVAGSDLDGGRVTLSCDAN